MEYSAVITRMPESSGLILNRVCSVPVQAPASMPAPKAARDAIGGVTPWTSSVAATDAPSVTDPSAVISGKAKIRKLMNTPKASNDRMKPMVNVPTRRLICVPVSFLFRHCPDPTCATDKLALLWPCGFTVIGQEVEHPLQGLGREQRRDCCFQIEVSLLEGAIGKCRGVKVPHGRCFLSHPPQHRGQAIAGGTGRHT